MIVREAYRDVTHYCCRDHYFGHKALPADAPPLGRVEDARGDRACEFCDAEATLKAAAMKAARAAKGAS